MDSCVIPVIAFSPPMITEEDIEAVTAVLRSGWITTGQVSKQFEWELTRYTGAAGTVLVNSATAGLELGLRQAGVGPGDEVIVPAYTYTATASVVAHIGAQIVFVDNAPGQITPSISGVLAKVTDRTKAVITVDIAGVPFDNLELMRSLSGRGWIKNGLQAAMGRPVVIADAAHSLGAQRDGVPAGAIADMTSFSFHAVKNLTTAEGGALQWRTGLPVESEIFANEVRLLSLHGQSKSALEKSYGNSWQYDIKTLGWKYNMPDVLAALGLSQLRRYSDVLNCRREMVRHYSSKLSADGLTVLSHEGKGVSSSCHLAIVSIPDYTIDERDRFIERMRAMGVMTNVHYKPLPMFSAYRDLGYSIESAPNAFHFYSSEVTLPLHLGLTDGDLARVIESVRQCI